MGEVKRIDVSPSKDVEHNVRKVTVEVAVTTTADTAAEVADKARELVDKALGKDIAIDGFDLSSQTIRAAQTGPDGEDLGSREVRTVRGFKPGKQSTVFCSVTVRPPNTVVVADYINKIQSAVAKSDQVSLAFIREGS